jgi:two-component system, OmpR family, KDP operon response regulator KdpE
VTHVLIVEDDPLLRRSLTLNLTARGYGVDDTGTGEDALQRAGRRLPDVIFVDLGLPTISGIAVIKGLRQFTDAPIIVLSARGAEHDKVEALDAGATDYVTKPFGIDELLARLRVAERIRASQLPPDRIVQSPDLTIDHTGRRVFTGDGTEIHLTPIEWALLARLSLRPGTLVNQAELLTAVWGSGHERDTNYLRVHITHLRKKIEPNPSQPVFIVTEPGVGYRFEFPGSNG